MAGQGGPYGNQHAKKGREWFDALRKECVQRKALDGLAKVLVDKALAGEAWAIQEIANRFDGKPGQSLHVEGELNIGLAQILGNIGRGKDNPPVA